MTREGDDGLPVVGQVALLASGTISAQRHFEQLSRRFCLRAGSIEASVALAFHGARRNCRRTAYLPIVTPRDGLGISTMKGRAIAVFTALGAIFLMPPAISKARADSLPDCKTRAMTGAGLHQDRSPITPMTDGWISNGLQAPSDQFVGAYTRLIVQSWPQTADLTVNQGELSCRPPSYKVRDVLSRYFLGTQSSLNLTVDIKFGLSNTAYTATVPLLSADHISDAKNGEQFNRNPTERLESFPLFLVPENSNNTVVSVTPKLKASDASSSQAAAAALSIAQNITKAVAPQAAVVTTLTQQSTQQVATAIDTAISNLFAKSIGENHAFEEDIRKWIPGEGVFIRLFIPDTRDDLDFTAVPTQEVGEWLITFDEPRPSIFSGVQVCDPIGMIPLSARDQSANNSGYVLPDTSYAHQPTPPARAQCEKTLENAAARAEKETQPNPIGVLQFHLLSGSTDLGMIQSYVKQQPWYATSTTSFIKGTAGTPSVASKASLSASVGQFCASVNGLIQGIGLNAIDASIVVQSLGLGMTELPVEVRTLISDGKSERGSAISQCKYRYLPKAA